MGAGVVDTLDRYLNGPKVVGMVRLRQWIDRSELLWLASWKMSGVMENDVQLQVNSMRMGGGLVGRSDRSQ